MYVDASEDCLVEHTLSTIDTIHHVGTGPRSMSPSEVSMHAVVLCVVVL